MAKITTTKVSRITISAGGSPRKLDIHIMPNQAKSTVLALAQAERDLKKALKEIQDDLFKLRNPAE